MSASPCTVHTLTEPLSATSFDIEAGTSVACIHGSIWVTGPAIGDIVLQPGQRVEIHGAGRVGIQALVPEVRFLVARARVRGLIPARELALSE
jgi:hypothetical protein